MFYQNLPVFFAVLSLNSEFRFPPGVPQASFFVGVVDLAPVLKGGRGLSFRGDLLLVVFLRGDLLVEMFFIGVEFFGTGLNFDIVALASRPTDRSLTVERAVGLL